MTINDLQVGNINNLSRQIEVLNDNILKHKIKLNTVDNLNANGGALLNSLQLNQIKNYLHENCDRNSQHIVDTLGVLKDEMKLM